MRGELVVLMYTRDSHEVSVKSRFEQDLTAHILKLMAIEFRTEQ
jgi:hypothetical protein